MRNLVIVLPFLLLISGCESAYYDAMAANWRISTTDSTMSMKTALTPPKRSMAVSTMSSQ
jgi:uncharacterized protein YceK